MPAFPAGEPVAPSAGPPPPLPPRQEQQQQRPGEGGGQQEQQQQQEQSAAEGQQQEQEQQQEPAVDAQVLARSLALARQQAKFQHLLAPIEACAKEVAPVLQNLQKAVDAVNMIGHKLQTTMSKQQRLAEAMLAELTSAADTAARQGTHAALDSIINLDYVPPQAAVQFSNHLGHWGERMTDMLAAANDRPHNFKYFARLTGRSLACTVATAVLERGASRGRYMEEVSLGQQVQWEGQAPPPKKHKPSQLIQAAARALWAVAWPVITHKLEEAGLGGWVGGGGVELAGRQACGVCARPPPAYRCTLAPPPLLLHTTQRQTGATATIRVSWIARWRMDRSGATPP